MTPLSKKILSHSQLTYRTDLCNRPINLHSGHVNVNLDFYPEPALKMAALLSLADGLKAVNALLLRERIANLPVTPKPNQDKPDYSLPRSHILRLRTDFERIKTLGRRQVGRYIVCNYLYLPESPRLAGFIVPKACGNAVIRNKVRRRLKELYRLNQGKLPEDLQSVWIARRSAKLPDLVEFKKDFEKIVAQAGFFSS